MKLIILIFGILISLQSVSATSPNVSVTMPVDKPKPATLPAVVDLTWASEYVWDGFKVGNSPVWEIALKSRILQSPFSVMLWGALRTDRTQKRFDEGDAFLMYSQDFFANKSFKLNVHGYYDYWFLPNMAPDVEADDFDEDMSKTRKRGNKFQAGVSFPSLLPVGESHIIPSYNVYYWLYYENDREDLKGTGVRHELAAAYDVSIRTFIPKATYQYTGGTASVNYHTGVFGVTPGLSHLTASIHSGVYALNAIFEVSVHHQWSLERTVNEQNELWSKASLIKKF